MAGVSKDQVLRLSNRISTLEAYGSKKAGVLSVVPDAPASFTSSASAFIGFSSKVAESGIISGNSETGTFAANEDCTALLIYQQEITHSGIEGRYHLDLYGNGSFVERIASCRIPVNVTETAIFAASVNMAAGVSYSLKICADGNSGTHTPQYQNSRNRLTITVTPYAGPAGPPGRKGDKGDKGDAGTNAPQTAVEYSADGQSWHAGYASGDDYIRLSADGGNTWGAAVYIRGRQGVQGIKGEIGTSYRMLGAFDAATSYVNNAGYIDCVTYNGSAYYAKQGTTGNLPGDATYWGILSQKGADGTGDVKGPSVNADGRFPQWNGSNSKTLKDGMSLSDIVLAAKQAVYPVGSLYYNADNSANPAVLLGFGTWAAFAAGRVPVGYSAGDSDFGTIGATPGEKKHALTTNENGPHGHLPYSGAAFWVNTYPSNGGYTPDASAGTGYTNPNINQTSISGLGTPHNNIQPSIVVYIWKRTA